MTRTTLHSLRRSLGALTATILFSACADHAPAAPGDLSPEAAAAAYGRFPDLGDCHQLQVPAGSRLSFHVFAVGVQIYRWDGSSWAFVNPSADLFADAGGKALVGTHFGGPTWRTVSGSQVVGTVADRCTPNPTAIAWLLLDASPDGSGVFEHTTFIQRVNTVGGLAPAAPGSTVGEEARVPYTADYFFYRP